MPLREKLKFWSGINRSKNIAKSLKLDWDNDFVRVRDLDNLGSDWNQDFRWTEITRVCFWDGGISMIDVLILELSGREKPARVLTAAEGGTEFLDELVRRNLFPQDIFDKAIKSTNGAMYCWPPIEN